MAIRRIIDSGRPLRLIIVGLEELVSEMREWYEETVVVGEGNIKAVPPSFKDTDARAYFLDEMDGCADFVDTDIEGARSERYIDRVTLIRELIADLKGMRNLNDVPHDTIHAVYALLSSTLLRHVSHVIRTFEAYGRKRGVDRKNAMRLINYTNALEQVSVRMIPLPHLYPFNF